MFAICLSALKGYPFIDRVLVSGRCTIRNFKTTSCCMTDEKCKERKNLRYLFGKYLILTNIFSSAVFMSVGDLVEQEIEYLDKGRHQNGFDWTRNRNMSIVGACQGMFAHCFYKVLDAWLPGVEMATIAKKIFLDQTICSPVCFLILFGGLEFLGSRKSIVFLDELKDQFLVLFAIDCAVWVPAQCMNFYLLPPRFRVIYVNIVAMCYNVFLSFTMHG